MKPDAVVVGGGIVGAACGEALAVAGLRVLILESGIMAGGATAAGMGHLVVLDDSDAEFALCSYSLRLWRERAPSLPPDCEDDPCGTVWVAADQVEMVALPARAEFYRERGVDAEVWDETRLRAEEPNLREGLAGAFFVPGDRVLYPPNAARWLAAEAIARGATVREGQRVAGIAQGRVVLENSELIETGCVVNAAGVEAPALTPGLPVVPRKGHLVITDRYPGLVKRQLLELGYLRSVHAAGAESVAFNVQPRTTGQLLVGSSREFVGHDSSVSPRVLARMLERAASYMPCLRGLCAIRVWTGFRPSTPDKLPLIGEWENGVFVAAGHEGLGITTSLGTGRLLADLVTGRTPGIDPAPFAPRRVMASGH